MLSACSEKCSSYRLMHFQGTIWECLGRAWSDCDACQVLCRIPHMAHSAALSCFQVRQILDIHPPFPLLIAFWREGIRDLIWPGSQFWQLGDQNKGQCHALPLPDPFSGTFLGNKGEFHLGSKFENSGCRKDFFFFFLPFFSLSHANLCFHGNRNENLLAARRQVADDSSQYQISAADFQITVLRNSCYNKHKDFTTILAPRVCITLKQRENG